MTRRSGSDRGVRLAVDVRRVVVIVGAVFEALLVDERFDQGEQEVARQRGDPDLEPSLLADEEMGFRQEIGDGGRDEDARRERHERMEPMVEPECREAAKERRDEGEQRGDGHGRYRARVVERPGAPEDESDGCQSGLTVSGSVSPCASPGGASGS